MTKTPPILRKGGDRVAKKQERNCKDCQDQKRVEFSKEICSTDKKEDKCRK
jgi:hypothetical protein